MTEHTPASDRGSTIGRLFNLAANPTTIVGVILTTLSAIVILTFTVVEIFGDLRNPYIGTFAYLIMPIFFVIGLILVPIGMVRHHRRLLANGATSEELRRYPRLDFNDPKLRRVATVVLVLTAVNAVILGSSSFFAVEETETVEFCGITCHSVMQPEYTAYQGSPHSRVACVECHIGPGASWFVRSKLDGLRQVWHTMMNTYHRPIQTPLRTLRPARETCEQCHWPSKHHGDKLRVFARFGTDRDNTPSYTAMLLRTGGGRMDLGAHGGIHWWHIYSDNKIRYAARDERRDEIVWVELTTPDGEVRTYTRPGEELPPTAEIEAGARIMDCIDCHNRPTHLFQVPAKAIDAVLEQNPEFRGLPYFKRKAIKAISATYASHGEGVAAVRQAVMDYYQDEQPDVWASSSHVIQDAAHEAAVVYGRTVFPGMGTNWETHPNHIGHDDFPGCWRCHDDELATADGTHVIPMDCDNCHVFLVEDSPTPPDLAKLIDAG